ncbi:GntR family transcriptional regulator [Rossellomorea sp. H39__3]
MDAYKYIKGAIIDGRYTPGMRLGEEFLAKELNLSRTPIREAIRHLEADGLVVP